MSLSTIQPQIDAMLKLFTTLPTVAIDTTSHVSQFVQQLLSIPGFFAAAVTSEGKPQVVVMNFSFYEKICKMVGMLPTMFAKIQVQEGIAAGAAKQLDFNVTCMVVGTALTIVGVYKTAQALTRWNYMAKNYDKANRWNTIKWKTVVLAGIVAIGYSMLMTHKVARGLQDIA